jgi:hypothetical protein
MSDKDWVRVIDEDFGEIVVKNQKKLSNEKLNGHYIICPNSSHQMHMHNPTALTNLLINDLIGTDLPILQLDKLE